MHGSEARQTSIKAHLDWGSDYSWKTLLTLMIEKLKIAFSWRYQIMEISQCARNVLRKVGDRRGHQSSDRDRCWRHQLRISVRRESPRDCHLLTNGAQNATNEQCSDSQLVSLLRCVGVDGERVRSRRWVFRISGGWVKK